MTVKTLGQKSKFHKELQTCIEILISGCSSFMGCAWSSEIILALLLIFIQDMFSNVFMSVFRVYYTFSGGYECSQYLLKFTLASLLFYLPLSCSPVAHTHVGSLVVLPFTFILKFYRHFEPISFFPQFSVDFFFLCRLPGFCVFFSPNVVAHILS